MEIKSRSLAEQQLTSNTIINFPNGIPGFEDQTRFQLFHQQDSEIVYSLQSMIDDDLAFPVALPSHFSINYNFTLTNEEESILETQSADDVLILLILHKDDSPDNSSHPTIKGSIQSPLIINSQKRIGIQKLLTSIEQSVTLMQENNEIELSEV